MKKYTFYISLLLIGIGFLSCSSKESYSEDNVAQAIKSEMSYTKDGQDQINSAGNIQEESLEEIEQDIKDPVLLIRSGLVSFNTKNMSGAVTKLRYLNRYFGNTIFSENQYENQYSRSASFSLGIEPKKFDTFLDSLDQLAVSYTNKTISGEDVTDQVVDVRSRIKTKKTVLERYMSLLNNAKGMDEILRLEREVGVIQEEIESTEARYNSLMHRVNLSKLEISIHQELKPHEEDTFKEDATDAFDGGTDGIKSIIVGALYLWPFWIISGLVLTWLFYKRKQWKKK